ncbi:hypothetical protein HHI36_021426 [Cryptolaemus montrouzieri]|uniref:Translational activator of cytochrome c oxidase 1 n=1 Tax=Cryptolaemus montrouzieri TaxID=559131 RepID=A0ABD2MXJ7_9CUCU
MIKIIRKCTNIYEWNQQIQVISKRFAGHSKWANIRHIKSLKDAERANLFLKLSRQMKVAVSEGGSSDPNSNLKLEQVIAQAKRANMPAATIQSVLKSTQTDKNQCKSHILEIKGPGSSFILCEVFTSSFHTLKQSIATILRKNNSKFCDGIINQFTEKGIIEVEIEPKPTDTKEKILEKATDDAIEVGAEDVAEVEDNILQFICGSTNFKAVTQGLEKCGYNITSAIIEYLPLNVQALNEKDMNTYMNLYEKLDNLPEVTRICHNVEV